MKKHFYHSIAEIKSLHLALDELELTPEEKQELVALAEENLHHAILYTILSELSEKDKKAFLALLIAEDHDEIWNLLKEKISGVEEKVKKVVEDLKKQLHEDIKEAHTKK